MNAEAALNGAPEAARQKESEEKRCRAKSDQIPDAASAEERLDQKEDHGAENRPFECPQTADEGHENHVSRPLNAKVCFGLEANQATKPQRTGRRTAEGGQNENKAFVLQHAHAQRSGGFFVVANGLNECAGPAAKKHK